MNARRAVLAALLLTAAAPALADTLIDNVKGSTIGTNGQVETFTGLLFDNAGTIVRVIHAGDKKPKPKKEYQYHIDGKGGVLLPGMIDAHAHVMDIGFAALSLDLSETASLSDALAKIRSFVAEHPDRPWIVGGGWNQETWNLGRFPTAAELDAVTGNRPVLLRRVDGHAVWANSAALKAAGITAATRDPVGGKLERNADGSLQGVLVDTAMELLSGKVPAPRPDDRDVALATAQQILFKRGVTAVADMGTGIEDWQAYRRAGDANRLYVRIMAYAAGTEQMILIGGPGPSPWLYADRLRLNGVKLYLDGALGSRGAWLKKPYADAPTTNGLPQLTQTQLGNLMSRAAMDNFQVAIHAIGDQGNAAAISAVEDLSATYKGDRRWRIEHAQIVDPQDFARFGKAGVIASMQPVHQTSDRTMAEARLGPDRLAGAYAWKSLQVAGAKLAFGSDAPVEKPDPWAGLAAAISRQGTDDQPAGGWQPQERLDRASAFAAYTSGAAFAGFAEQRFGRLAPGLRADFILVDTDPLVASPEQVRATRVLETWVGGGRVWEAAQPESGRPMQSQ
ncbi:amidohydrolase [Novosphingobium sp. CECT 9465]|uniref:amidohydrolase n=1 Tax=Novosphingobium sp. CECT 9465 TaxID=2829794 RepID=UPI001E57B4BD|nr:amidohydrolase [Novosphingobium sp. CECT 9465]CAH0495898.1 N-substituted formamide deformylase [Novosphingobium sp. CECT 9465]